jgi:hypothetical protein
MAKLHKLFALVFSDIILDCYINNSNTTADALWLSRENIGKLLGLNHPTDDVKDIHKKHKKLLDALSINQNGTVFYDFRALLHICYHSDTDDAQDMAKLLWGIVDGIFALRRFIDSLSESEAKEFIKSIPDKLTFQEFILLCLKGGEIHHD